MDVDEKGVARIAGSGFKIKFLVIDHIELGKSPTEIQEDYDHLSLAQIHAGLAYYFAHREEMDAQIAADRATAERFVAENANTPHMQRLREETRRRQMNS